MFAFGGVMAVAREKEWAPCSVPTDFLSGCRRAASFPFFGDHALTPISVLKVRSQSESEGLNKLRFASTVSLDNLRRRPRDSFRECEESSDCASDADSSSSSEDGDSPCASPSLLESSNLSSSERKSVRFADDCGKDLFCVRVMTEPSDQPPYLSPRILKRWRGDFEDEEKSEHQPEWKMLFRQPASEYVKFRETLERAKVAVENVIMKPEIHKIVGTIKVMNIAFEKRVFLRVTNNHWKSYVDQPCVYQPSTSKIHDTFTFDIEIPRPNEQIHDIEFCVCFVAGGEEHWDSNGCDNYKLQSVEPVPERRVIPSLFGGYKALDRDDAYKLHNDDWAGFASWKNLSTDHPYW